MSLPVLSAAPITLRHIKQGATGTAVLAATLTPQPKTGINGRRGWQSGNIELALNDEGTGTLNLPNTVGDDGILHRRRFALFTSSTYHPGDEWIEVLQDNRPLFVGTPIEGTKSRTTVTLTLADGSWMLNTQRETAAGFWNHAPRDVFEHYTKAWRDHIADDFTGGLDTGRWTALGSTTNGASYVRMTVPATTSTVGGIRAIAAYWGAFDPSTHRAWRLEARFTTTITGDSGYGLGFVNATSGEGHIFVQRTSAELVIVVVDPAAAFGDTQAIARTPLVTETTAIAIECRDRWLFFYYGGQLVHALEYDVVAPANCLPGFFLNHYTGAASGYVDLDHFLLRKCDSYLIRGAGKGDYRLPGILPSGGLQGAYYDEANLRSQPSQQLYLWRVLAPTKQPYARRQDATVNFPAANPATWQPPGPSGGEYFSAQWTGAIYLDLATSDMTIRIRDLDDSARLFVGKTMWDQHVAEHWTGGGGITITSGSLRTHLGTSEAGWYPIRIDYAQIGAGGGLILEWATAGVYTVVPTDKLSPYGCYNAEVRYDSHLEQLKAISLAFGLQWRCEPLQLESGEFPGRVLPKVRVGRDTDKILTPDESTEAVVRSSAEDVLDTLLADAAGLSDQANAAQLTAESVNYLALNLSVAARHMMILSAYESLSDITDPQLLQTRLASMLGLRLSPWEEVSARPRGHRERRDTFPLTGSLAAFDWEPGDGIRLQDEALDLFDENPRQIIAPSWPIVPDGRGAPSVRFRQRPRDQQDALRTLVRSVLLPQRNYQGQLVVVNGSTGAVPASAALPDTVSRVSLPTDLADVVRAELVVQVKTNSSSIAISVNGVVTLAAFTSTGRFDITPYMARDSSVRPRMYAGLSGGSGTTEFAIEMLVRA